jgi:hypothetical protein
MFARLVCVIVLLMAVGEVSAKGVRKTGHSSNSRFASAFSHAQSRLSAKVAGTKNNLSAKSGRSFRVRQHAPVRMMTSTQYITMNDYADDACSDLAAALVFGTDMCLPLEYASDGAKSVQYVYSDAVVSEVFYSDDACTTQIDSIIVIDATGFAEDTCIAVGGGDDDDADDNDDGADDDDSTTIGSAKYTVSSTFSSPNGDGFYTSYVVLS